MPDILTTITDAEAKVVETVRSWQEPVAGYVRRGVAFADAKLPDVDITYPKNLPSPSKVVDTQVDFLKSLLDAQRDLAKAVVTQVGRVTGQRQPSEGSPAAK
jgi:hypothetical protein